MPSQSTSRYHVSMPPIRNIYVNFSATSWHSSSLNFTPPYPRVQNVVENNLNFNRQWSHGKLHSEQENQAIDVAPGRSDPYSQVT